MPKKKPTIISQTKMSLSIDGKVHFKSNKAPKLADNPIMDALKRAEMEKQENEILKNIAEKN